MFDSVDESNILMDCCHFDWIREGKNLVEKYVENHPPAPETAELDSSRHISKPNTGL